MRKMSRISSIFGLLIIFQCSLWAEPKEDPVMDSLQPQPRASALLRDARYQEDRITVQVMSGALFSPGGNWPGRQYIQLRSY